MLKDVTYPEHRRFKSRTSFEPIGFFSDCLCNATQFDLMLGFFSSSAISVLSDGFAFFLYNGGYMRLIIHDVLTEQDRYAIVQGSSTEDIPYFDIKNIELIKHTLSERDTHFFECLAWLIRNDKLDIKIVAPKEGFGIAHTKSGVFSDGINIVGFDGSCNFSRTALIDNIESITAFCDWDSKTATATIGGLKEDFNRVFEGNDESVDYIEPGNVKVRISNSFKSKELVTLLEDEYNLLKNKKSNNLPLSVKKALEKAQNKVEVAIEKMKQEYANYALDSMNPKFPYESGPRDYQKEAFEKWKANNQKGLFAMATGTGKTITSLNCLLEIYKKFGYYKALILVPTLTLVEQWEKECIKFGFFNIVKISSKNTNWNILVKNHIYQEASQGIDNVSYILISTYASYTKSKINSLINQLSKKMLLIADEAHNMGANNIRTMLKSIPFLRRIGLSATPDRQYDEIGNLSIANFFCVKQGDYTYEYSMKDAIDNGVLCEYFYFPHIVRLTESEMSDYQELSLKIAKYFSVNKDAFENKDKILTNLLLARKRIIHKASNKKDIFKLIMKDRLAEKGNLKYSLIYVPEGNNPDDEEADMFTDRDDINEDSTSNHLIDIYSKIICDLDPHVTVRKFTSDSHDREALLSAFANGDIDVLTSMKCLDEGIDVPRSEFAVFCSSTGNPRQFIQRRGRILRQAKPYKKYAYIHDLIVTPEIKSSNNSYQMERSLLRQELKRVNNFALLSKNPSYTCIELKSIMEYYNLTLFDLT